MITTIIITALVSVSITLVLGYFIWSGISVRKLKKQVKDNTQSILANTEYIKHVEDLLQEKEDQINKRLEESDQTLWSRINDSEIQLNKKIDETIIELHKKNDEMHGKMANYDSELHRELDKRFDKVYQTLTEKK